MPRKPNEQTVEHLKLVLEVTRRMGATTELRVLLEKVAEAACTVLECERATVFLLDRDRNQLYSKVATGVREIRFDANKGIAGEVASTGEICNVPDAYADPRFNAEIDKKTGFRTRNILTIPLDGIEGKRIGVLQLLNKKDRSFGPEDEELAGILGAQAGVALQRQILLDEYATKLQMERDLDIARDIQTQMLPKENPTVIGYEVAGWNKPADRTGGDCYDFLLTQWGRLGILIADATGHGITAAMCISQFRAMVKATSQLSDDLGRITTHVNNILDEDLPDDRFVTSFIGVLDPTAHTLSYIAAGQGPLLHYHRATGETDILAATDLPLGITSGHFFEVDKILEFSPGDIFCLLTDGFYEWQEPGGELFGDGRVVKSLQKNAERSTEQIIEQLYADVLQFSRGTRPDDDLTAIIIKRNAEPA